MSKQDDGGPAFPISIPGCGDNGASGMSLRDYFIAHAPAEPQEWFQPAVDHPLPEAPLRPADPTAEEKEELYGLSDYLYPKDCKQPRVREYAFAAEAYKKAVRARNHEEQKQRYVQWPAAWADEMLKARQA